MGDIRHMFEEESRGNAVRRVRESGEPLSEVARDLGLNPHTLKNWVELDLENAVTPGAELTGSERAELVRLRRRQATWQRERIELEQERDALKRSLVLWVREARER